MGWWSLTLKHSDLTDHKDPSKLIWLLHRLLFPGICTSLPASSVYPSAKRSKHRSSHSILSHWALAPLSMFPQQPRHSAEGGRKKNTYQSVVKEDTSGPRPDFTANKSHRIVFNQSNEMLITSRTLKGCHGRGVAQSQRNGSVPSKSCRINKFIYHILIYLHVYIYMYIHRIILLAVRK